MAGDACDRLQGGRAAGKIEPLRQEVEHVGHPVHQIIAFEVVAPYCIHMEFADGLTRTIDFRPLLEGQLFGPLRDLDQFNSVTLDPEARTLVWPNGADFDPATLHDWPEHEAAMAALARRWGVAASEKAG